MDQCFLPPLSRALLMSGSIVHRVNSKQSSQSIRYEKEETRGWVWDPIPCLSADKLEVNASLQRLGEKQEVMSTRFPLQALKQGPGIKLLTPWIVVGLTGNSRGR